MSNDIDLVVFECFPKTPLHPLYIEVCWKGYGVGSIINSENIVNIDTDSNLIGFLREWKLKFWIVLRKAYWFVNTIFTRETSLSKQGMDKKSKA